MISKKLISWYEHNKRDLPWRNTKDPYKIWLSEIILQQTRVAQGLPYYLRFVENFPTVFDLARAPQQKVLKLWEGLGYYSRARNLHEAARYVVANKNGVFPTTFSELKNLKGVGDYTAAAVSSFCFNEPQAVVDGNVFRVLSRLFAIGTPIDSSAGKKQFSLLANELLDKKRPGIFNQAIMEFGAQYCVPANPNCAACVLKADCASGPTGQSARFPVKAGKTRITTRHFEYFFIFHGRNTFIEKREKKGIWQDLYQPPLIEFKKRPARETVLKMLGKDLLALPNANFEVLSVSEHTTHLLSHQRILARFWQVELKKQAQMAGYTRIRIKDLGKYPFPVLVGRQLKEITIFE